MYWLLMSVAFGFNLLFLIVQMFTATANRHKDEWADAKGWSGVIGLIVAIITFIWQIGWPNNIAAIINIAANITAGIAWIWLWRTDRNMDR